MRAHAHRSRLTVGIASVMVGLAVAHRSDGIDPDHDPRRRSRATRSSSRVDAVVGCSWTAGRTRTDCWSKLDRRLPPWDRRIDILVLTHPHEDHVAGMALLLERYRVGKVFETGMRGLGPGYKAFARKAPLAPRPSPRSPPGAGSRLMASGSTCCGRTRAPSRWSPRTEGAPSTTHPSFSRRGGRRRFLLAGDVEDDVDPILAERGLPTIDILKVAHHGSGRRRPPRSSPPCARGSLWSRPGRTIRTATRRGRRSTASRRAAHGSRTDTDGSVTVTIDPKGEVRVATSGAPGGRPLGGPRAAARVPGGAAAPPVPPADPGRRVPLRDTIDPMTPAPIAYFFGDDDLTIDRGDRRFGRRSRPASRSSAGLCVGRATVPRPSSASSSAGWRRR